MVANLRQAAEAHTGPIASYLFNLSRGHEDPDSQGFVSDGAVLQSEGYIQGLGSFKVIGGAGQLLRAQGRDILAVPCKAMQNSSQEDGRHSMKPNKPDACICRSQRNGWLK